jgi:hypothetical protein
MGVAADMSLPIRLKAVTASDGYESYHIFGPCPASSARLCVSTHDGELLAIALFSCLSGLSFGGLDAIKSPADRSNLLH